VCLITGLAWLHIDLQPTEYPRLNGDHSQLLEFKGLNFGGRTFSVNTPDQSGGDPVR